MNIPSIGQQISPLLETIEDALWEHDFRNGKPPEYTIGGFRASIRIFASALIDQLWNLQEKEGIDMEDREAMSEKCGQEIRKLVKTFTDIDTHDLYKKL